ncbi:MULTISPECIES: thioesterase II family protein [Streptosporangium]|uniref:Pyochelin biosynthetic protein PchC n=1 Tax=Streptosporangium brasiliense TaxID=47480 RepID=A0ABT9RFN5_9ACTN|nr:alpha/beta fold hydrolase [Streptosporangium brasiliense]MDP9867529.1 pyochelin biosynthetic protein PchC [Streptosporangium brasiliense]
MTETIPDGSRLWLRRQRPLPGPRLRLICMPHAGGTPAFYRGWQARLPADIEFATVCYPGRQDRIGEPPITRMDLLSDRICQALAPLADRPLALFGHSMGAVVAYEVAVRLATRQGVTPAALLVSAHIAPQVHGSGIGKIPLRDDELAAQARSADPLLRRFPELMSVVLPALRADHDLLYAYRPACTPRLPVPITAYRGADDERVSQEDMRAWSPVTDAGIEFRTFPGGHFYLLQAEADLVADIGDRLGSIPATR